MSDTSGQPLKTESKKHGYRVRPAYGSKNLLIEFMPFCYEEPFRSDLRSILAQHHLIPRDVQNLVIMSFATFDSPCGPFELEFGEFNMVFVLAEENQDAIHYMDRILSESGLFQKEEVNHEDHA